MLQVESVLHNARESNKRAAVTQLRIVNFAHAHTAGTPSLPSTTSLPTSQELAEIFGTSDDEDDDYPFPLSSDLPTLTGSEAIETKQFPDSSLLSSIMAQDTGLFLDQLGDPLTMGGASEQASDVVKEEGASSTKKGVNDVVGKTLESGQKMEVPSDGTDNQSDPSLGKVQTDTCMIT